MSMKERSKFLKLDRLTTKHFMKPSYLLVVLFVFAWGLWFLKSGTMPVAISVLILWVITTQAFYYDELGTLDELYTLLGIRRSDVVKGRYINLFSITLSLWVIALVLQIPVGYFLEKELTLAESMLILTFEFMMAIVALNLQLPIFFKNGYAKGRVRLLLIQSFFMVSIFIFGGILVQDTMGLNALVELFGRSLIVVSIGVVVFVCLMTYASYRISRNLYEKREF